MIKQTSKRIRTFEPENSFLLACAAVLVFSLIGVALFRNEFLNSDISIVTPTPTDAPTERVFTDVSLKSAGKVALLISNEADSKFTTIWTADADGLNKKQVPTLITDFRGIDSWSLDNKYLLVTRANNSGVSISSSVVDVETGEVTDLPILDDYERYYFWGENSTLRYIDTNFSLVSMTIQGEKKVMYKASKQFKSQLSEYRTNFTSYMNNKNNQLLFDTVAPNTQIAKIKSFVYDYQKAKLVQLNKGGTVAIGWSNNRAYVSNYASNAKSLSSVHTDYSYLADGTEMRKENLPSSALAITRYSFLTNANYLIHQDAGSSSTTMSIFNRQLQRSIPFWEGTWTSSTYISRFSVSRDYRFVQYTYTVLGASSAIKNTDKIFDTVTKKSAIICDSICLDIVWQN